MEEYIQAYSPEFLKQLLITLEERGCTGNYIMDPKSYIAKKLYNCRSQPTDEREQKDWWIISNTGINNCIDNTVKNAPPPELSYTEALKKARVPYEKGKMREAEFKKRAIENQRASKVGPVRTGRRPRVNGPYGGKRSKSKSKSKSKNKRSTKSKKTKRANRKTKTTKRK